MECGCSRNRKYKYLYLVVKAPAFRFTLGASTLGGPSTATPYIYIIPATSPLYVSAPSLHKAPYNILVKALDEQDRKVRVLVEPAGAVQIHRQGSRLDYPQRRVRPFTPQ